MATGSLLPSTLKAIFPKIVKNEKTIAAEIGALDTHPI